MHGPPYAPYTDFFQPWWNNNKIQITMGRIKTLDVGGGGINKKFPPKYLALADIEKKCQDF